MILFKKRIIKELIRLRGCAGWSAPLLFANPRRQVFSRRGPFRPDHGIMVLIALMLYCKRLSFGGYFYLALLAVKTKIAEIWDLEVYSFEFNYTISNRCIHLSILVSISSKPRVYER